MKEASKEVFSVFLIATSLILLVVAYFITAPKQKVLTYSQADTVAKYSSLGHEWNKNGAFTVYSLEIGSDGYLYFSDFQTIKRMNTTTWEMDIQFGGFLGYPWNDGSQDGEFLRPYGLGLDNSNNIFVTDSERADIQKFTKTGSFLTKWGEYGTGHGQFNAPTKNFVDSSGNIYVVDSGNKRIEKFSSSGVYLATIGSGGTGDGQFEGTPSGISVDSTGHIFVSEIGTVDRVNEFDASGVYVTRFGATGTGDGQFNEPWSLAHDSANNLYVLDKDNSRVQKFDSSNTYVSQFGSHGTGDAQLDDPRDLDVDASGNIYISDYGNCFIKKFTNSGTFVRKTVDYNIATGDGYFQLAFYSSNMAVDAANNVYIPDIVNNRVQKFNSSGSFVSKFGSVGTGNGQFNYPTAVAFDSQGNIYVGDNGNSRIEKFDSSGNYLSQWGSPGSGDMQFAGVTGMTITSDDHIYVATGNSTYGYYIKVYDTSGTFLNKFAVKVGTECVSFCASGGMAHDSSDNVYVVDWISNRVKKFTSAGAYVSSFPISTQEYGPTGLTIDSQGYFYVVLTEYDQVRKYDPEGNLVTIYGTPGAMTGQLYQPVGVVLDNSVNPNMYIMDAFNQRVQKFTFDRAPGTVVVDGTDGQTLTSPTVTVTGTVTDSLTPITAVQIKIDGTGNWLTCNPTDGGFNELSENFVCTISGLGDGDHFVEVRSTDSRGNTNSGGNIDTFAFTVDTTPSPTPTETASPTPTGTLLPVTTTAAVTGTPSVIVASTVAPSINGSSIVCPEFTSFSVSQTIIEKNSKVRFAWKARNTTAVKTPLSSVDLAAEDEFTYTPDRSMDFVFIADNGDCIAKKVIPISVVETLPWASTVTVGTGILAVEAVLAVQQPAMFGNLWLSFAALVDRRKKLAWGVAYDAASKKPLPRAVIRLIAEDKKVVDTVVSDATGTFKLKTHVGSFTISVTHPSYTFPSVLTKGDVDGGFSNVYHGESFAVKDTSENILFSIPLDPKDISQMEKAKVRTRDTLYKLVDWGSVALMAGGFLYSTYVAYIYPHIYNYIVLGLYTLMAISKIILSVPKKTVGEVLLSDGTPAKGIELGLYDVDFQNLLYRTFTDNNGVYSFVVPNKAYVLKIMDERYSITKKGKVKGLEIKPAKDNQVIRVIAEDLQLQ